MRSFSEFEKTVLKFMVENKEPGGVLACVIIERYADAILLDWSEEDHIKIVTLKNQNLDIIRQKLFDLISLFKYLSKEDYIYCFPANLINYKMLYNHNKYDISKREDGMYNVFAKETTIKRNDDDYKVYAYLAIQIREEVSGIGNELETWVNSSYHVTQNLRDFVKNGFKTQEQLQYEKNKNLTWISITVSIVIGLASLIIGCIGIYIK